MQLAMSQPTWVDALTQRLHTLDSLHISSVKLVSRLTDLQDRKPVNTQKNGKDRQAGNGLVVYGTTGTVNNAYRIGTCHNTRHKTPPKSL